MSGFTLKVVIRCRDFAASRDFYARVLGLPAVEEWAEPQGKGCIFAFGEDRRGGCLEIYEMSEQDPRFDPRFREPVASDKIDVQLGTDAVDAWAERLRGVWPFEGPDDLPWGQRWIRLRDPDGWLIAVYQDGEPAAAGGGRAIQTTDEKAPEGPEHVARGQSAAPAPGQGDRKISKPR